MKRTSPGFTLIEVMIALLIFSIMAAISSTMLYHVFNSRDKTTKQSIRLSQIQIAFVLIKRDLSQIVNRKIQNQHLSKPSFEGEQNSLRFSRGGIVNPNELQKRSTLARISYTMENHQLIRHSSAQIDAVSQNEENNETLLSDVKSLSFAYLDNKFQVLHEWKQRRLPVAIRIDLELKNEGAFSILYALPSGFKRHEKI